MKEMSSFIPRGWPDSYSKWLTGIHLYLRENGRSGLPVYLNAEEEDFRRIAVLGSLKLDEASINNFVSSVRETIKVDRSNPQQAFSLYGSMRFWKASKYPNEVPPFLPVLMLCVLAAEQMRSDESFISTNYYGRLAVLAGYESEHKDKIGHSYRKYIASLWDVFNDWLAQNPQVGQASAIINVSQGYNDYVGVPVGQALLRSGEQETIEVEFFEKFFNSGGSKDEVEIEEFIENLDAWVASAYATHRIKSIYAQAQEVLRVNIWELFERWQPRTRGAGSSGRKAGLKLVLRMTSGLKGRAARFSINANYENVEVDSQSVEIRTSDGELMVTSASPDQYTGTGTMLTLGDRFSDVLSGSVQVIIRNKEHVLFNATRQPRAMIPFEAIVPGTWVETTQMKLGLSYILVTAAASLEHTMALLQKFGTGAIVTSVAGLPEQWKLITGFTLTSSIGAPDNLPIQRVNGAHLSLIGGLKLPGSSGIPEFPISEPPALSILQVAVGKKPILRIDGPGDWQEEHTEFGEIVSPAFTAGGEYVVRLFETRKSTKSISYRRFVLRDSDSPRYIPAVNVESLGVHFISSKKISVNFGYLETMGSTFLQGARLVHGELNPLVIQIRDELSAQISVGESDIWDEDIFPQVKVKELAKCILDPYALHLSQKIDLVPGRRQRFQRWVCSYCGTFGYIDTRGKKKNQEIEAKVLGKTELPKVEAATLLEREVEHVASPREVIEKRIWTLGGGNLREAGAFSDLHEMNLVTQVLWGLAVSGHIDIAGMESDLCSGEWRTNPLTAIAVGDDFRLVGHRSIAVIDALHGAMRSSGGTMTLSTHKDPAHVSDILINGVDGGQLKKISSSLGEQINDLLYVDETLSEKFLFALLPLTALRDQLPRHSYMDTFRTTEYFDLKTAKWLPATSVNLVGRVVRDAKHGTTYRFVVGGDPTCYQAIRCGYRLGKHLSAHWNKIVLMNYDAEKQLLSTPLGAELPLLYSRGVVFTTGSMPYRVRDQTIYSGVTKQIYEQIKTLLSE
jgi:hypothetical protein